MYKYFLLFSIFVLCVEVTICEKPKIIGGSDAEPGQFPYQVSLESKTEGHFCGGSILSKRTILTAAHCVWPRNVNEINVYVGSNTLDPKGQEYKVVNFITHHEYQYHETIVPIHDYAVIYLDKDLEYSSFVQPIELEPEIIDWGINATVSGWGYTQELNGAVPNTLQFITTTTLSLADCRSKYYGHSFIMHSHLCADAGEGFGTCNGDSGSPLVLDGKQIGIVSYGPFCGKQYPDVFSRVSYEFNWISSVIV